MWQEILFIDKGDAMKSEFLNLLVEKARVNKQRIAFPEVEAERILQAAQELVKLDAAIPVLIGEQEKIQVLANQTGVSLEGMEFVNNEDTNLCNLIVQEYMNCNNISLSEKGITRKLKNKEGFAAALVKVGRCDCFVSGFQCTTAETIFAAQNIIGMQQGISTVSSLCILEANGWEGPEKELLCLTDCVVSQEPDSEALADIAISACETMKKMLGWEPRAAMLSYSTKGSGDTQNVLNVVEAVKIANEKRPDLYIDGEFQLDAAIDPETAAKKVKTESKVAGRANIIVFPDLNAGNIGVKLINIFGGYPVHGALLAGLARPCVDLSRSAPLDQIVGACVMLAVTAQNKEN